MAYLVGSGVEWRSWHAKHLPVGPEAAVDAVERHILAIDVGRGILHPVVLLALSQEPRWSGQIRDFITELSESHLAVDEQSMHRALRRLEGLNLITHSQESVAGTGAKRKIYELTTSGERVLASYLQGPMTYVNSELFRDSIAAARHIQPS